MTNLSTAMIAGASLLVATAAGAQMKPQAHATTSTTAHVVKTSTTTTAPRPGRMVTARLANGKTVTYDCSKPGNKSKAACK